MQDPEVSEVESFGGWIQRRRRALNLTRDQLAEKVGCAAVTIKKIERDERRPSPQIAALLAEQLLVPRPDRERFMRMAREPYAVSAASGADELRIPAFLQQPDVHPFQSRAGFVERHKELSRLGTWLDEVLRGNATPVFLLGEAGSGKTSLMREFARIAQSAHPEMLVAGGQCNAQTGPGDPFRPFRDILGILTGDLEIDWSVGMLNREQSLQIWDSIPDVIRAITDSGPHLLNTLIPVDPLVHRLAPYLAGKTDWFDAFQQSAESKPSAHAGQQQDQVLEELTQAFRAIARKTPLLLILDDLQWADDASLNLLYHLGRRLTGSRILLLGSYRTGDKGKGQKLGEEEAGEAERPGSMILEMARQHGDIQVKLDQASQAEGRAFIDALLDLDPNRLGEAFRENLYVHTRGHPLFTTELIQSMRQNRNLVQDADGSWVENSASPPAPAPARVEAVIEQRLAVLNPRQRELLNVASVEGQGFTAEIVANVLGLDWVTAMESFTRDLEQQHHLVAEQGVLHVGSLSLDRFQFHHMLIQEHLYGRLIPGEKRRLHRRLAEELEKVLSEPEGKAVLHPEYLDTFGPALLHHSSLGEEWEKAAVYAFELGKRARQRYAMREAIAYFERALDALSRQAQPNEGLICDVILGWQDAAFNFTPYDLQLERLSRAEQIARKRDDKPRLVQVLHWKANVLLARGRWSQAGPTLTESLALAQEVGDEKLSVRPLYFKALMTSFGDPVQSLAFLATAREISQKHTDGQIEALAFATEGQVLAGLGDFARARQALDDAHAASGRLGSPVLESDVDHFAAWAWLAMGDMTQAMEFGQRSLQTALATDNMDCTCGSTVCIGYVNLELGKLAEAATAFEQGVARSEAAGALIHKQEGQAGLATVRFLEGHPAAIADLEAVIEDMRGLGNLVGAASANQMLGTCLFQLGEFERAAACLDQAVAFYRQAKMHPSLARALNSLAALRNKQGRTAEAGALKAEAEAIQFPSGEKR